MIAGGIPTALICDSSGAGLYAARAPGGLFAPLLTVGALIGHCLGGLCQVGFPALAIEPQAFAVVGMAAFFTGVVRAPITGIVLAIEMTAAFTTLLPMLGACFTAMLAAGLLGVQRSTILFESAHLRIQAGQPKQYVGRLAQGGQFWPGSHARRS